MRNYKREAERNRGDLAAMADERNKMLIAVDEAYTAGALAMKEAAATRCYELTRRFGEYSAVCGPHLKEHYTGMAQGASDAATAIKSMPVPIRALPVPPRTKS